MEYIDSSQAGSVVDEGEVLGVAPKSYLPNYREFYEKRWFASGAGHQGEFRRIAVELPFQGSDKATSDPILNGIRLAVIGLGYVGLPLAVEFAQGGLTVVGIDVDEKKVAALGKYASQQHRRYANAEYVWNLARVHGINVNREYAECFQVYRIVA